MAAHVAALERHVGTGLFDYVLANNRFDMPLPNHLSREELVALDPEAIRGYRLVAADLADLSNPWRHDPSKLAAELMDLCEKSVQAQ